MVKIISGEEIVLTDNSFIILVKFNVDGGDPAHNPSIIIRGEEQNMGGGLFIKNVDDENFFEMLFLKI